MLQERTRYFKNMNTTLLKPYVSFQTLEKAKGAVSPNYILGPYVARKTQMCIKLILRIGIRSKRREAVQSMKFLINIDCLGTYGVK